MTDTPTEKTGLCSSQPLDLASLNEKVSKSKEKLVYFESQLAVNTDVDMFSGTALIVFSMPMTAYMVLGENDRSFFGSIVQFLKYACKGENSDFEISDIYMERAPEPTDVYWENLKVKSMERWKLTCKTYFMTLVVIAVCFAITYVLNSTKDDF